MINPFVNVGVQKGWQCPVCQAVYAPFTPSCLHCIPVVIVPSPGIVPVNICSSEDKIKDGRGENSAP